MTSFKQFGQKGCTSNFFNQIYFDFVDKAILADTEKESVILRIQDLEQQLESAKKDSSDELAQAKANLKKMETEGQAHDNELTGLLRPLAKALSGTLTEEFLSWESLYC